MDNMRYYNTARAVPKEAQKAFNNGSFSGTDINPQWRKQMLTEMFGPCGIGWYIDILEHWREEIAGEVHTHVRINLYVRDGEEWSKPIAGIGGNKSLQQFKSGPKASDEGYKMALTDAISVACANLGIGADVYFQNGRTKYTDNWTSRARKETAAVSVAPKLTLEQSIAAAVSMVELTAIWQANPSEKERMRPLIAERRKQLGI